VIRKINTEYKLTKTEYETMFNEPAHKFRVRHNLGARTPEQKRFLTSMMRNHIITQAPNPGVKYTKEIWWPTSKLATSPVQGPPSLV
jgi:hypothetical protein